MLTLAVAALALGLASSAMPAGKGRPSLAQAWPAIDAAGVLETVEHHVDPVVSPEYPVSDPSTSYQAGPSVAFDGTNYVAAWAGYDGTSGSLRGGPGSLRAARVSQFGSHLDGPGIDIGSGYAPSVAFDGTNYLVVWETGGFGGFPQIKGARVNQAGVVLDPAGITITVSDPHTWQVEPSVAFDGTNYQVVWHVEHDWPDGFENIGGRRISPSGALLGGFEIIVPQNQETPAIAPGGENTLVVWRDWRPGGGIYGARVSNGAVLDSDGIPITTGYAVAPSVAFDGTNYLVVWVGLDINDRQIIHGKRISQNGTLLDESAIQVSTEQAGAPSVAFDGANYVVAWENYRLKTPSDIYGARVSPDGTVLDGEAVPIATSPTHETAPAATAGSVGRVAISYERVAPEHGGANRAFLRFFDDGVSPPPPPPPSASSTSTSAATSATTAPATTAASATAAGHTATSTSSRPVRCAAGDRLEASPGPHADQRETLLRRSHPPCSL